MVRGMNACSVEELLETIFERYETHEAETLERVRWSLFLGIRPNTPSDGR